MSLDLLNKLLEVWWSMSFEYRKFGLNGKTRLMNPIGFLSDIVTVKQCASLPSHLDVI
jgi:type IV secretory pathway component VirB8